MTKFILALDVGTTNIRSFVYTDGGVYVYSYNTNVEVLTPELGASEIDPDHLWAKIREVTQAAVNWAKEHGKTLECIGVSLQRNTGKVCSLSILNGFKGIDFYC